jgi:hypothetical protein
MSFENEKIFSLLKNSAKEKNALSNKELNKMEFEVHQKDTLINKLKEEVAEYKSNYL